MVVRYKIKIIVTDGYGDVFFSIYKHCKFHMRSSY